MRTLFVMHIVVHYSGALNNILNNQKKIKPDSLKRPLLAFTFFVFFASSLFNVLHNVSPCDQTGATIA